MGSDSGVCPSCGSINRSEKYNTYEIPTMNSDKRNIEYTQNIPYINSNYNSYNNMPNMYGPVNYSGGEPVSVLRWIGRMLIPFIPFVGGIINLIMLIVWACSDRFERTSKNWAIARIIIVLVQIVISVIIGIFLYAVFIEVFNDPIFRHEMQSIINGI